MYKSPIESFLDEFNKKIIKKQDADIYQAVLNCGVNVDKDELIRALQYDRGQYEKGYADGKADAMANLVRCKDCKNCLAIYGDEEVRCGKLWTEFTTPDDFCSYGERK